MAEIVIIHFGPVELYPPLQNFIRFLEQSDVIRNITVVTTAGTYHQLQPFASGHQHIKIKRLGRSGPGISSASRIINYLAFFLGSIWLLLMKRPRTVFYYETISSFPAWCYKRFINGAVNLMIHYHEYSTPAEYASGMWLTKYFHQLESWLYPRASWVSHTNSKRMELFINDLAPVEVANPDVVPNFPPRYWHLENVAPPGLPMRFVYVGALSLETMYTKQMAAWVERQHGRATWDIYSVNVTSDAVDFLHGMQSPWITLHDGIDYSAMPAVLRNYHVGVILYNGHIPNYVYNAPNKLFEYINAGLKVWLPTEMEGAREYVDGVNVKAVDFSDLPLQEQQQMSEVRIGPAKKFYAEEAFASMKASLLKS